jgi:hypothetical protein
MVAAACRVMTRRAIPARPKRQGKESGVQGTQKGRTFGKRHRARPQGINGRGTGARETVVASERLDKHVPATTDKHATVEVMLETVFYTGSVQRGITKIIEAAGREPPSRENLSALS